MKLNGWSAGVLGMAAGAALSLAGAPAQAQTPNQTPKTTDKPTTVRAEVALPAGSDIGNTGAWWFKAGDEEVKIEIKDGNVVHATRNGKDMPAAQVSLKDGQVKILDDKGATIFEMAAPSFSTTAGGFDYMRTRPWRAGTMRNLGPGATTWWDVAPPEPAEPPKVMMGVTLAEPEYGLRKHCGLDQRSGTMVNEVYKGLPAAKAGIEPYDVIIEIDGKTPATPDVVRSVLASRNASDEVTLTVLHKCEPKRVVVKLDAYDADRLEKARQEQMKAAGIEPGDAAILARGEFATPAEELHSLIARVQGLDNKGAHDELFVMSPGGDDRADYLRRITEAMKHATDGTDAASGRLNEEKVKRVEDRLDRLEKMLERLMEQKEKEAATAKPATPRTATPPKASE